MGNELLYKYRDWESEFGKNILIDRTLYFSSFADFNDPFDSDIMVNYEDLTEAEIQNVIARNVDHDYPNVSRFKRRLLMGEIRASSALGDAKQLQKNYEEYVRPQNERELGILSLSKKKENLLMWSHYANSHKGYCVGLDREYLQNMEELSIWNSNLAVLDEVKYSKEYPKFNGASNDPKTDIYPLLTKSADWAYEEEVRLIIKNAVGISYEIHPTAIREVIFGLKISKEVKEKIKETVRSELPHVELYQAKKAVKKFALEFDREEF